MSVDAAETASGKVFKPFKRSATVAGVPVRQLPKVLAAAAAGLALFLLLGIPKAEVIEPLNAAESYQARQRLEQLRDAAAEYGAMVEAAGTDDPSAIDADDRLADAAGQAAAMGIGPEATDEQIEALMPEGKPVEREAVDPLLRALLWVFVVALAYAYHTELGRGWSICTQTRRMRAYGKRQRAFASRGRDFVRGKAPGGKEKAR